MIAEIILIPEGLGLDAAKAGAQYVARGLSGIGMKVREQISLCPDTAQFQKAIATALARSNLVVTIGGMGRESGYLAKTVLSRGLGLELLENAQALNAIRDYCKRNHERFEPQDSALALLPRGAAAFPPEHGKLPGCVISSTKQHIVMLPENKAEIAPMFNKYVTPYLGGASTATVTRTLRTYGVREDGVLQALGDMMHADNPAISLEREGNEVLVRVAARAPTPSAAAALCTPTLKNIVDKLGDAAYGLDVPSLEAAVVSKLEKKGITLAVAEAGTGGVLSRIINETPGGQDALAYALMADTPESKVEKLGLPKKLLKKHGNVGEYAAVATANAVREKAGTQLAVAVLANVGDDSTRACRVGDVYIAVATADTVYVKKLVVGDGDADEYVIVDAAVSRALNMTRLAVDYYPEPYTAAIPLKTALENPGVTELSDYEEASAGRDGPEDAPRRGFFDNFVIHKTDRRGVKVRKFIFILAMLVFLGSLGYIGLHYYQAYEARRQAEELNNMFQFGNMEDVEVSPDYPKNYSLKFAGLWNVNPDVVAYVAIPGTQLKYPIVQAADNDYYLRRDFYGKSNQYGIPFMDYRVDIKEPSDNLVIYGHNMKDGQIFGQLIPYNPIQYGSIGYYKEHPVIECTTVYNENKYKIFSVFITNAYESQGPVFAYHDFIDAKSREDFSRYVEEVKKRSLINTTVDVEPGDELVTLSTCTYEFKDARLVVVGRAVRRGESEDVDVENASRNPSPLMPDIWYKTYGGNKPIGEETAQIVTSASVTPRSGASASALPSGSGSVSSAVTSLSSSSRSSSQTSEDAAAREAESRAASRRAEQSRLAAESSRAAASKAASDAAASKAASDAAASKAASDAKAEAIRAAEEEASRRSQQESSRVSEEEQDTGDDNVYNDDDLVMAKTFSAKIAEDGKATLTVRANGKLYEDVDERQIVARIVQSEIGAKFAAEAIKAQAVAAYTFVRHANARGDIPNVVLAPKVDRRVVRAVDAVLGEMIYYDGEIAFTPYHSTSSGKTAASASVWGGNYPYLVPVDSSVDKKAANYKTTTAISREKVEELLEDKLGITPSGSPSKWFKILKRDSGSYVTAVSVCGETTSASGDKLTGRYLRENVLGLRSSCFKVKYDSGRDAFLFTTYGYGHGVGMSQNGANLLAAEGWSYIEILEHYYPGTTVE